MTTITLEKNAVRKANKLETLALTVVMAASPVKTSKAYKDGMALLKANGWTAEQREAWVAGRNAARRETMAPESKLTVEERRAILGITPENTPAIAKADEPKAVVAAHVAKAEAKRNAKPTGPSLKAAEQAEREARTAEFKDALDGSGPLVEPSEPGSPCDAKHEPEVTQEPEAVATVELPPVTNDEMMMALAIIERASKQQAEALRKAAAERKKVAPEGAKVAKVKTLTPEQQAKADALAANLKRLQPALDLIGSGKREMMALMVAGLKTPDIKLCLKAADPKYKLTGVKVPDLRKDLIAFAAAKA